MKSSEALYNNMLSLLNEMTGPEAEAFEITLAVPVQAAFSAIITGIIDQLPFIEDAKLNETIFPDSEGLIQAILKLKTDFPTFVIPKADLTLTYLTIFKSLMSRWTSLTNYRLRPSQFSLKSVDLEIIAQKNYIYHDTTELVNSIALITTNDISSLEQYLSDPSTSELIMIYLLSKFGSALDESVKLYVFVKSQGTSDIKKIMAYLKFQMIMDGKYVHSPFEINHIPVSLNRKKIKIDNDYRQFGDTLTILSEYNYQKDLLDKYLRLYHVLENNMYRTQIVKVESESSGLFSIRDFQRLYTGINRGEDTVLKNLMTECFELTYDAAVLFKHFVLTKLAAVRGSMTDVVISDMLTLMRINNKDRTYNLPALAPNSIAGFYATVVYMFRNSMVHNRETEFHLMHETLSPEIKRFMIEFLIPTMEELIVLLTSEHNAIIWYTNPSISLYKR